LLYFQGGIGPLVMIASQVKRFLRYIPQLLPKNFMSLSNQSWEMLEALEKALATEPWVFAFSTVCLFLHKFTYEEFVTGGICRDPLPIYFIIIFFNGI